MSKFLQFGIPIALLILLYPAVQYGDRQGYQRRQSEEHKHGLNGTSDASPIIVSDGSSIHFHQNDRWSYTNPSNIAARLPNHHAYKVRVRYCTVSSDSSTATQDSACGNDLVAPIDVSSSSWSLALCDLAQCGTPGSVVGATIAWDKSKGDDTDVEINSPSQTFTTESSTGDGASLYLPSVHIKYVQPTIGGTVQNGIDCSNPPSGQNCTIRISYCKGGSCN
jgi:hypothetical protein